MSKFRKALLPAKHIAASIPDLRLMSAQDRFVIYRNALLNFRGRADVLRAAIGCLELGVLLGWKPLYFLFTRSTLKKYEAILGVRFNKQLPPTTIFCFSAEGFHDAVLASNFWKVIKGEVKIAGRGRIGEGYIVGDI